MTCRAGSRPPVVITASPVGHPPCLARIAWHSARIRGPPARWIAPSTPPPPRSDELAALTIASASSPVMSPRTSSIVPRPNRRSIAAPSRMVLWSPDGGLLRAVEGAMLAFEIIAEQRIREAIERGEFDRLPGAGQPLKLEDDAMIPPELRVAYKILKNAGCLPPELELRKEIVTLRDLLRVVEDDAERTTRIRELNHKLLKLSLMS